MARTLAVLDLQFPFSAALSDLVSTLLDDLSPAAIHETGTNAAAVWRVFFTSHEARDEAERVMREYFTEQELRIDTAEVLDDDWAARSQADLRAVRVGRLIVAPPWDVPTALEPGDRLIVIKPSMGFGTGHHATTRLCLDLLQQIDCRGRQGLDIGTGSGVLAIAAGVLGARHVTAIDVDPDAIANARENIRENRASGRIGDGVCALVDDLHHSLTHPPADIVLANLTGATLTASARQIVDRVAPGGWLVLSGVLDEEIADVVHAFEGLAVCKRVVAEAEWRAGVFHRFQRYSSPQA